VTGWEKVIAATLLAVIGLVGLNLAIWRRMRAALRSGEQNGQSLDQPVEIANCQVPDGAIDAGPARGADPIQHSLEGH
jgi:hypothetical protein